jgi:hypothetical protein
VTDTAERLRGPPKAEPLHDHKGLLNKIDQRQLRRFGCCPLHASIVAFLGMEFSRAACEDEPMLTETQVRNAVAKGIEFLDRTREPYGLLFMDLMHRRFGVPQFADALKRYDEEIGKRPKEAPVLRVLRRAGDANNPLRPDDWDHVQIQTDRILATALYCDRLGLPSSFAEVLGKAVNAGGYHATHALLTWTWVQDNRCKLAVPDGFVERLYGTVAAILEDRPDTVTDLKLEAAAFLCLARQGKRVAPGFIGQVVAIQRPDGGWGKPNTPDPAKPDESSWHSTTLALLLLLHVTFPSRTSSC